jgi:hypothetical protein
MNDFGAIVAAASLAHVESSIWPLWWKAIGNISIGNGKKYKDQLQKSGKI